MQPMAGWTETGMTLPQYQTRRFAHMFRGSQRFAEPLTPNGAMKKQQSAANAI
jgi:hypothetical protein